MKPKTEVQRRVVKLTSRLPELNSKQIKWGKNLFDKFILLRKYDASCLECGSRFKNNRLTCPICHSKLQTWTETQRSGKDYWYMSVFTTVKEFQVLRYFRINKYMKVDKQAEFTFKEVYQHWISSKGKHVLYSRLVTPFAGWRFDAWSNSPMEVRSATNNHMVDGIPMYPFRKILPELFRNGFCGEYFSFHPARLFTLLLGNHIAETFVKANNIDMLKILSRDEKDFTKYWSSYKICMRHKFKITDWSTWLDHMRLLKYFRYDLQNPKYICSPTFMDDHQRLVMKKRAIEDRIHREKLRLDRIRQEQIDKERLEKATKELKIYKEKFFDMKFSDDNICIVVLNSIEDFKLEQDALLHCVYDSKYYEKKESLILSARKDNTRLETIEFDLEEMRIVQCRGKNNKSTRYHRKIINLVNNNVNLIKQIANG